VATSYDVVVIGSGTGGYVAAIRATQLGLKVGVVEKQKALGGTCLIWGCIPTKALLEHAHALKIAQHAREWGLMIDPNAVRIDMNQVQARKDKIVGGLTRGVEYLFKKNRIDWIKGTARIAGPGRIEVADGEAQQLQCKEIIAATGSAPRSVPGVEIDRRRIITSDEAIGLKEVPKSLLILGSGAVGVEFASIFRRFGSEVTIIELLPRLVPLEDDAVSAELEKAFRKQGIKVLTNTKVSSAQAEDARRLPAGRDWPRPRHHRRRRRRGWRDSGKRIREGGRAVSNRRARNLGNRRRYHDGRPTSATRPRVIGGGHCRGGTTRRPRNAADQLRSCARLYLLRS
jgi:dihydrolipoamide dehydrogenase